MGKYTFWQRNSPFEKQKADICIGKNEISRRASANIFPRASNGFCRYMYVKKQPIACVLASPVTPVRFQLKKKKKQLRLQFIDRFFWNENFTEINGHRIPAFYLANTTFPYFRESQEPWNICLKGISRMRYSVLKGLCHQDFAHFFIKTVIKLWLITVLHAQNAPRKQRGRYQANRPYAGRGHVTMSIIK